MLAILVPIDGSPSSERAIRFVIGLYPKLAPLEVRLLNVQLPELPGGLDRAGAAPRIAGQAEHPMRSSSKLLDAAKIPYASETRTGHVPQVIAQYAKDANCSAVVMGTRGMGTTGSMLGSVARQVINLVDVPVTLVK